MAEIGDLSSKSFQVRAIHLELPGLFLAHLPDETHHRWLSRGQDGRKGAWLPVLARLRQDAQRSGEICRCTIAEPPACPRVVRRHENRDYIAAMPFGRRN